MLSLFPAPKKVEKTGGVSSFSQKVCLKFDDAFKEEALLLKSQLTSLLRCSVSDEDEQTIIELKKMEVPVPSQYPDEYYEIVIKNNRLTLKANDAHGIFNLMIMNHYFRFPFSLSLQHRQFDCLNL